MTTASHIANILGSDRVLTGMESLARYAIGGIVPEEAVLPSSASEVVDVVKYAFAENRAIVATGAQTKLSMGAPPSQYQIAVDLSRMNRVISYDPGDLTLSVEPGMKIAELYRVLAEHGQMLPLGVPWNDRSTIAGTIASGIDAPQRQLYGTPRDFLLGAEFVTGDGVLAKGGGRVVKNVTGYDLHKLLIGSLGTLGIITRLNFKTFPMPRNIRGFVARFPAYESALAMRDQIARSPLAPLTLDIFSPASAKLFATDAANAVCDKPFPSDVLSATEWALSAGYAGNAGTLARYEKALTQFAAESGAAGTVILSDALPAAWTRKREFLSIALASNSSATVLKVSVVPTAMKTALKAVSDAARELDFEWAAMARGVGVMYVALFPADSGEASKDRAIKFTQKIQVAITQAGGHATVPWCPAAWKAQMKIWGEPTADWHEMRKVKQAFDPKNILSPGRFVGGI